MSKPTPKILAALPESLCAAACDCCIRNDLDDTLLMVPVGQLIGQRAAFCAEIVRRWNALASLLAMLERVSDSFANGDHPDDMRRLGKDVDALLERINPAPTGAEGNR